MQGIVYGIDLQGNNPNIQFTLIDNTGGIGLFSTNDFGYEVNEGDELIVLGSISQFSCLTQISPDTLWLVSTDNMLNDPTDVDALAESTESEFIKLSGWFVESINGSNASISKDGASFIMRIDSDTGIDINQYLEETVNITGLGGQFDNDGTCDSGYQIFPRYDSDVEIIVNTLDQDLGRAISYFPNPVFNELNIKSTVELDQVVIVNALGQVVLTANAPQNTLKES